MTLRRVQVTDFRCLHRADLDLDPNFTLISGPNASGKTSLLEAIYVLGRGRSFRTRRLDPLIRSGAERMMIVGEAELPERRRDLRASKGQPRGCVRAWEESVSRPWRNWPGRSPCKSSIRRSIA